MESSYDVAIVDGVSYIVDEKSDQEVMIHPPGDPDYPIRLLPDGDEWRVDGLDEDVDVQFERTRGLDLATLFPPEDVCPLSRTPREELWRITRIPAPTLNYLRRWLERNLRSVAINWIVIEENGGVATDETLGQRLGLLPLVVDPQQLEPFDGKSPETTLQFDIDVDNDTDQTFSVTTDMIKWVPLGDQEARLEPPHPLYPDQVVTKLPPGAGLHMSAFATLGLGKDNAKWTATHAHYRVIKTKPAAAVHAEIVPYSKGGDCKPCGEIATRPCSHFSIHLISGVTFGQIQDQLDERFQWGDANPFGEVAYNLPPMQ